MPTAEQLVSPAQTSDEGVAPDTTAPAVDAEAAAAARAVAGDPAMSANGAQERAQPSQPAIPITVHPATIEQATFEALMAKKRRRQDVTVRISADDAKPVELKLTLQALSGPEFDKLADAHQPTSDQLAKGAQFNGKTMTPALLEACVVDPKLTYAQWQQLIENDAWAAGEIGHLFNTAWQLCNAGLNVSFTVTG